MAVNTNIDLVGDTRPVVTPQATAQMSQMVREGTISVLDIMDRVDERTRAKQELELVTAQQGIADATNPELIQAKRNQQLAAGAQAGSALTLNPLAEQAKTAELKAAIFDAQAKPGGFTLMQEALSKAGFPVSVDPNAGLTDANKNEIIKRFSALQEYTLKLTDAEEGVKNIETKFFPTEQKKADGTTTKGQLQKLFRNGQEITSDELKSSAQKAAALKRTPFSQWYSLQDTKPGQVVAPAPAAPVTPAAPLIQPTAYQVAQAATPASDAERAQLFNAATTAPTAPIIQPTQAAQLIQPAPAIQSATPQLGQVSPGLGIVTGVEAAQPAPAPKPPNENQSRAGAFASRMASAENLLTATTAGGFDATTAKAAFEQALVPEGFKTDNVKRFEGAKKQWITALLRRESGAAIPKWELEIYGKAFFPAWDDPPDLVAQKTTVRQQAQQSLMQESQGLPTFVPPGTPIAPPDTTPAGTLRVTLPGRGNVEFDPLTQRYRPIP